MQLPEQTSRTKRIISFSLYGMNDLYVSGMVENIRLAPQVYPGWTVRVYAEAQSAELLYGSGSFEVYIRDRVGVIDGMFWRFEAVSDPQAEYVIVRDADSRLNHREAAAVNAWIESGRACHTMRDHPHHVFYPMLGGMWGLRGGVIENMRSMIAGWGLWFQKGQDQDFLRDRVWPLVKGDCVSHESHASMFGGMPFPKHEAYSGFVGEVVQI
jgi:hypothetical protein